jgi:hypothetical protein
VIPVPTWKELITHYYRDNELVGEYLGAKDENPVELTSSEPTEQPSSLYAYVPSHLTPSEGVQISVSYHDHEKASPGRHILSANALLLGNTRIDYLEADTLDLIKLLRRNGEAIRVPENISWIAFEDSVVNFPLILHTGPTALALAAETLTAVRKICQSAVERRIDELVAFHVGIAFGEFDVYFSFAGHVEALSWWLGTPESSLPSTGDSVGNWVDLALGKISTAFPNAAKHLSLWNYLQSSGLLELRRRIARPEELNVDNAAGEVTAQIGISTDDLENANSNALHLAEIVEIKASVCTACKRSYEDCNCIKAIDQGVVQEVIACERRGLFYTNRPS